MQCTEYCGVHACTLYSLSFIRTKLYTKNKCEHEIVLQSFLRNETQKWSVLCVHAVRRIHSMYACMPNIGL